MSEGIAEKGQRGRERRDVCLGRIKKVRSIRMGQEA